MSLRLKSVTLGAIFGFALWSAPLAWGQDEPPSGPVEMGPRPSGEQPFPDTGEFLQKGRFPEETTDADKDGVFDIDDNCPATPGELSTPAGPLRTQVDECGCPKDPCGCDADADKIPDCRDACPDTPPGEIVGADGCTLPIAPVVVVEIKGIEFDFDRHAVKPEYEAELVKVRERLLEGPNLRVRLEGHTDSDGPPRYNQRLSERRAKACREFVLQGTAIAPERISAVGLGESQPVADNKTEAGRAKNRRVMAVFSDLREAEPGQPNID
ncbi:MAG TPA: OmpA family protein [Verrucomicrobiae bacterium]|nr:OmpA family protein [Verrucomicrobiae bacterium]